MQRRANAGSTQYSVDSAQLDVHKIPSISFIGTVSFSQNSHKDSFRTDKPRATKFDEDSISFRKQPKSALKHSTTLPNDTQAIFAVRPDFPVQKTPPSIELVQSRKSQNQEFFPVPVMPKAATPLASPREAERSQVQEREQNSPELIPASPKNPKKVKVKKKRKDSTTKAKEKLEQKLNDVDFSEFMEVRLRKLELAAVNKEVDVEVSRLRRDLRMQQIERIDDGDLVAVALPEIDPEADEDLPDIGPIKEAAILHPRSREALYKSIEEEEEKDKRRIWKPKRINPDEIVDYEQPPEPKGEWPYKRKARYDELAREIVEKDKEHVEVLAIKESEEVKKRSKIAEERLQQVNKLLNEDEEVNLDELEGRLDTEPKNPDFIGPPKARNDLGSGQPLQKFDYHKFKDKKQKF